MKKDIEYFKNKNKILFAFILLHLTFVGERFSPIALNGNPYRDCYASFGQV